MKEQTMVDAIKFDLHTATSVPDPTTESGDIYMFPEALGQNGQPFVFLVEDPPNKTRQKHYHHDDVLYVYTKGEHHIEGEGTYRAGDLRWTRKGYAYGPETTGPEGGAWWVISYGDPIPVNVNDSEAENQDASDTVANAEMELPRFSRPYDWKTIDATVRTLGGAILVGLLEGDEVDPLNERIDKYLGSKEDAGLPESGSEFYNLFLGHKTVRLHGLIEKIPETAGLIGKSELVDLAERLIGPIADSVLLNAGELIQIEPGERAQALHRDTDSWPMAPIGPDTLLVNAIVALDPVTLENGATYLAPGSWQWEKGRQPKQDEFARAVMDGGDAVLFRGDILHGGGENESKERRRVISISYCAGWLRPVENSFLNVSQETAKTLPKKLQGILGYAPHDAAQHRGGLVGLYDNGDPSRALTTPEAE